MSSKRTSRSLFGFDARRRGTSIAAAALTTALVGPFISPIIAPQVAGLAVAQESEYTSANVGLDFSTDTDGVLRYATVQNRPEFDSSTGADAMITLAHWWLLDVSRKQVFDTNSANPDAGMMFLKFRDPAFYEAIDHIDIVGQDGKPSDIQARMYKRDPAGSEWQVAIKDYSFTAAIGADYQSNALIYLKDGVDIKSLPQVDQGFYVDSYYTTVDGKLAKESISNTTIAKDLYWDSAVGFPDEILTSPLGIANWFTTQAGHVLRYDQGDNAILSTTTFKPAQNFKQANYGWSAVFRENIDPLIAPFVESVEIFSSDMYGKKGSDRTSFALHLDPNTGEVTSERNPEISWKAGEELTSRTFSSVRDNQDDIFWGLLGQSRSYTIKYNLKPGSTTDLQQTTSQKLIDLASGDVYFDVQSWLEADFKDYFVWGSGGYSDDGADSMAVPGSYTHAYVNVIDSDGDGLTDEYETKIGTNSSNPDTDGDGVPDGQEQLVDKTDPKNARSYIPAAPNTTTTQIIASKLDQISGTAPKTVYTDPLNADTELEVTSTAPIPTKVYMVPSGTIMTDADGKLRVDTAKAVASDTYANLDELMKGTFTLTPTGATTTPGAYTLVAVSPAGEVTRGSDITITVPQTDDFALTIAGKNAIPLEAVTSSAAAFTKAGAPTDAPIGVKYQLQPKDGYTIVTDRTAATPGEVSIAANGAVTFVPRIEDADKTVTFDVLATYADLSEDNVQVSFPVGEPRDTDGDGIPDYQDPDQDGEMTDGRTLTIGVRVDGKVIESNGDNSDGGEELPETLRGLIVKIGDIVSGSPATWRGAKTYPVAQNFGLHKFELGAHSVTISDAAAWKDTYVLLKTDLNSSDTLNITGRTGNQYLNFETKQTTTYATPDAPLAKATTSTPSFTNDSTDSTAKNTGTTFVLGTLPAGYTATANGAAPTKPGEVSINPSTGAVTIIPLVSDISKEVTIPVTTVYVDGTTASSDAVFEVGNGQTADVDPAYSPKDATPTKPSTSNLNLGENQNLPAGTTFAGELTGYQQVDADPKPGEFTINDRGNVTLVPKLKDATKDLSVAVTLTYPDGSTDRANAVFNVGKDQAGLIDPSYTPQDASPTNRATSPLKLGDGQTLPEGTTITGAKANYKQVNALADVVPGTYFVSPTGTVVINPLLADANNQDLAVVVTFAYPDGSQETATAAFPVGETLAQAHVATYKDSTGVAYEKTTIAAPTVTPEYTNTVTYKAGAAPEGYSAKTSAAAVTAPGDYYVAPSGIITVIPLQGSPVEFPVTATFADGSTQDISAKLTVTTQADKYTPSYGTVSIPPNGVKSSPVSGDLPAGSTFTATLEDYTAATSKDAVTPGTFFIDPTTGELTVGAKPDQSTGEMTALVTVTYPDGTKDTDVPAVFDVEQNLAAQNSVAYTAVDVAPTAKAISTPQLNADNPGPKFTATEVKGGKDAYAVADSADTVKSGEFFVDEKTGVVTIIPRLEDANAELIVPVIATYSDTSKATINAAFNVGPTIAEGLDPTYSPDYDKVDAKPTQPASATLQTGDQKLPAGTTFAGALTGGTQPYTQVAGPAKEPGTYSIVADGTVTVVPRLEDANKDLTVAVTITYSDGSTDSADAVFAVGSAIADSYDPQYKDITGTPGVRADIAAPTGLPDSGKTLSANTPEGYTPKGSAAEVSAPGDFFFDTATGAIALVPLLTAADSVVTVPVTVTYSDGSIDELSPKVTVGNQAGAYAPAYTAVKALPGVAAKITAPVANPVVPTGTTFALASTGLPAGYTADNVKVADDGSMTVTPPANAATGPVSIPVVVTYPDGSKETIYAKVDVQPLNGSVDFTIPSADAKPGIAVTSGPAAFTKQDSTDPAEVPAGTKFSGALDGYTPQASTADVDAPGEFFVDPATGAVTIAPLLADANKTVEVPVTATYTDGTTDTAKASFTVGDTQAATHNPAYSGANATINTPAKQSQTATDLPKGTTFSGALNGYTAAADPADVKPGEFYVNPITGEVTVNPKLADANSALTVAVTVTYPDTSMETVDAKFTVAQALAVTHKGTYTLATGVVGENNTITAPAFEAALPDGVTPTFTAGSLADYTAVDSADAVSKLGDFFINPDGSIVVIPRAEGTVTIPVTATFSDGSSAKLTAPLNIISQANAYGPYYGSETVLPAQVSTSDVKTAKELPAGTKFVASTGDAGVVSGGGSYEPAADATNLQPGQYFINPDTGEVSIRPALADENKTLTVNVVVTYPDGSQDPIQAEFKVGQSNATRFDATYTAQAAAPAAVATSNPEKSAVFPDDAQFSGTLTGYDKADSADNLQPGQFFVDPVTGVVSVNPKLDDAEKNLSVAITVAYADGSKDSTAAEFNVGKTQAVVTPPKYDGAIAAPSTPVPQKQTAEVPEGTEFSGMLEGYEAATDADNVKPGEFFVNPNTGDVTVNPKVGDANGELKVSVTAKYPDGSEASTEAAFTVSDSQAGAYQPAYTKTDGIVAEPLTIAAPTFTPALAEGVTAKFAGATDSAPAGYTLVDSADAVTKQGDYFVAPDGKITVIPATAGTVSFPVTVTYTDGSTENIEAELAAVTQANSYAPRYDDADVAPNTAVTSNVVATPKLPTGTAFAGTLDGYTAGTSADTLEAGQYFVNETTGAVTVKPRLDDLNKALTVKVTATYPDKSTDTTDAVFKVGNTQAGLHGATYTAVSGAPATVLTSTPTTTEGFPDDAKFSGTLDGYEAGDPADLKPGQFYVDPATGDVSVNPKLADANKPLNVTVTVAYSDGSSEQESASFKVGKTVAEGFDPAYTLVESLPGTAATIAAPFATDAAPKEAKFTATAPTGYELVDAATKPGQVSIDATGAVTVVPRWEDKSTQIDVPVLVTYSDGSTNSLTASTKVGTLADTVEPKYADATVKQEGTVDVKVTLPEDQKWPAGERTFAEKTDNPNVEIAADGTLTVTAPEGASVGHVIEGTIIVTYADGSTDELPYKVTVAIKDNIPSTLEDIAPQIVIEGKPIVDVKPVVTGDAPTVSVKGLPDGLTFEDGVISGTPVVEDWGAEESKTFTVTVTVTDDRDEDLVKTFDVTVQRDTDGDGTPDLTDTDDDGDGVLDVDEVAGGSDPKDPNSRPWLPLTPATGIEPVKDQTVTEHKGITPIKVMPVNEKATVDVTVPEGLTYDEETGEVTGVPVVEWSGDDESQDVVVTVVVTNPDGSKVTETVTITVERDTDKDGTPDLTDTDDDGDGFLDEDEIAKGSDPKDRNSFPATPLTPATGIEPVEDQTVTEHKDITPIKVTPVNPKADVEVSVPEGLTYDPATGEVSGSPVVDDWGKSEESRDVDVTVVVTNPDGSKVTETVTITVERDTDKDGTPDLTDTDDDGDGFLDEDEIAKGSDPKDRNSFPATPLTPATGIEPVKDQTVTEHKGITPIKVTPVNPEADVEVSVPEGLTYDPATGEVSGSPVVDDWGKSEESRDVDVTVVVTNPDGSKVTETVTITVERDTDKDGTPDLTDTDDDGDGIADADDSTPKEYTNPQFAESVSTKPDSTLKIENTGGVPELGTFVESSDPSFPATINPETGEISVVIPADAADGQKITVTVKSGDGTVIDTIEVVVSKTPITPIADVTALEGKAITDIVVHSDDANATVKVDPASLPDGIEFDPETRTFFGTPELDDWSPEEETRQFVIEVVAVNSNGSIVTEEFTITVERDTDGDGTPDLTDTDDDGDGVLDVDEVAGGSDPKDPNSRPWLPLTPATGIESVDDQTVIEHKDITPIKVAPVNPAADVEVSVPEGLTFDKETGEVTGVPVVEWSGDEESRGVDVTVVVTNPDGSKVTETVTITVERDTDKDGTPDLKDTDDDGDGFSDEDEIAKGSDPKDRNSFPASPLTPATGIEPVADQSIMDGSEIAPIEIKTIDPNANVDLTLPGGLELTEDGRIVGTPIIDWAASETTSEVVISVVVTNSDGSKVTEEISIIVSRKASDLHDPKFGTTFVPAGERVNTEKPFGDNAPKLNEVTVGQHELWNFVGEENGVINAAAPIFDDLAAKYSELFGGKNPAFTDVVEAMQEITNPVLDVEISYEDGTTDATTAEFQLVGKDSKPLSDATGDFDGDGVSNKDEVEKGSNPFDPNSTPADEVITKPEGSSDAFKRCFADSDFAIWNPLYWLIPAGILVAAPLPEGIQSQLDGIAAQLNNTVNQLAGDLGIANLLPRVEVPAELNINTYMTPEQQRQLIGAAMVTAGLAATGFYLNWCITGGADNKEYTSSEWSRPEDGGFSN